MTTFYDPKAAEHLRRICAQALPRTFHLSALLPDEGMQYVVPSASETAMRAEMPALAGDIAERLHLPRARVLEVLLRHHRLLRSIALRLQDATPGETDGAGARSSLFGGRVLLAIAVAE